MVLVVKLVNQLILIRHNCGIYMPLDNRIILIRHSCGIYTCIYVTYNALWNLRWQISAGHLVLSHFGTCMCSNVETNLSWTCLVSGLLNFEHPSVLLVCFHSVCYRVLYLGLVQKPIADTISLYMYTFCVHRTTIDTMFLYMYTFCVHCTPTDIMFLYMYTFCVHCTPIDTMFLYISAHFTSRP